MQGIHLIRHAVYRTVEQGGQFVLLGSGHADGDFRAMAAVRQLLTTRQYEQQLEHTSFGIDFTTEYSAHSISTYSAHEHIIPAHGLPA